MMNEREKYAIAFKRRIRIYMQKEKVEGEKELNALHAQDSDKRKHSKTSNSKSWYREQRKKQGQHTRTEQG